MIKQLLNSAIAKYRDLSVARRSIICLCMVNTTIALKVFYLVCVQRLFGL